MAIAESYSFEQSDWLSALQMIMTAYMRSGAQVLRENARCLHHIGTRVDPDALLAVLPRTAPVAELAALIESVLQRRVTLGVRKQMLESMSS